MATFISTRRLAIFVFLFMSQSTMATDAKLRGVHPSLIEYYRSSKKQFTCLDGERSIPASWVNDDYCDCADGSDEPGTNACNNGRFYCNNYGFEAKNISSTRVNDGVCDCCDGSDEYRGFIRCQNVCKALREEKLREEKRIAAIFSEGSKIREKYVQEAAEKREAAQARKKQLEEEVSKLESELAEMGQKIKEAEKVEAESKKAKLDKKEAERDHNVQEIFNTIDANKDGKVTSVEIIDYAPAFKGELLQISSEPEHAQNLARGITVEEFKERIYPRLFSERPPPVADHAVNEEISDNDEEDTGTEEPGPFSEPDELSQPSGDQDPHVRELKSKHDRINNKLSDAKGAMQELDFMDRIDFGPQSEYLGLYGKQLRLEETQYIYELNMFKDAYQQDKTHHHRICIGRWGRWKDENYDIMEYSDGEGCWKGPSRSTTVQVRCGVENKLVKVNEPKRCQYEMRIESPAACSVPGKLRQTSQRPHGKDEL